MCKKRKNVNYRGGITNLRLIYMCTPINTHIYLFIYTTCNYDKSYNLNTVTMRKS